MKKITTILLTAGMIVGISAFCTSVSAREITFDQQVLLDNEKGTFTITGIEEDGTLGYTLKAKVENKTEDTGLMFSVDSGYINGVDANPLWASEVPAGKTDNSDITFTDYELHENGITEYTDIELHIKLYDSEDYTDYAEDVVHIYPYGEENATTFVREDKDTDNVIIDNEYAKVVVTGYNPDGWLGYEVGVYYENKTENSIMFSVDEASINDIVMDPFYANSLDAGKCEFDTIDWYNSDLEENNISEVNKIEFKLQAYNNDDYSSSNYFEEIITLNP